MSAFSKSKRINILQPDEIDNLFGMPIFNDDDREKWFDLNKQEQSLLKSKKTLESKIDLILQLGYFKAKHQFFIFTFDDVKNDVHYILHHLFSGELLKKTNIGPALRYV